jgi:hypothetical protein
MRFNVAMLKDPKIFHVLETAIADYGGTAGD